MTINNQSINQSNTIPNLSTNTYNLTDSSIFFSSLKLLQHVVLGMVVLSELAEYIRRELAAVIGHVEIDKIRRQIVESRVDDLRERRGGGKGEEGGRGGDEEWGRG